MALCVRWHVRDVVLLFCFVLACCLQIETKKVSGRDLIEDVVDIKQHKKLLRTKKNVLILYTKNAKEATEPLRICSDVALELKGQATLAHVDCSGEGKKLCKKLKVAPEAAVLKHYKDGEFHKDYDRKLTVTSMSNFLKDPTGDIPWEEEEDSVDVYHIATIEELKRLFQRETAPVLIMFYAPWCSFCKRLKPDYAKAATELKGHSVLAAMDLNRPENAAIRRHYNITGFPTLLYFVSGTLKHRYEGDNNKDAIVKFMKNPQQQPKKPKEQAWSDEPSDVVHLTEETFQPTLQKNPSVLVMFYAPWCGHCKKMKPEYVSAAATLKSEGVAGILAAVDATKERSLGSQFNVSGYPTVKYFENGVFAYDVNLRVASKIVEFMKDPKEPPPPPPPEQPWSQVKSEVVHLDEETFKPFLKRKKHALVMFYAPWCVHCKRAKPEFQAAAEELKDDPKVALAAVDCTEHSGVCSAYDVGGYPTFKYFSYLKTVSEYQKGKMTADFVSFIRDQSGTSATPTPAASIITTPKPKSWWDDLPGSKHIQLLKSGNFQSYLDSHESALVMFYAPWCKFSQELKPAFAAAALRLYSEQVPGKLAAVDASEEKTLASKWKVNSLPALKFFRRGKFVSDYDKRKNTVEDLVAYLKSPPVAATKTEL
nr:LOW QUALITY PROTEIN: protein disulfide-isomerase A5-like [Rhipicephalus microplus]